MLYRTLNDLIGTDREAIGAGWRSRRFLLAEDGLPFSLHETTVASGTELYLCYENHSESVYCIAGKASVEDVAANRILPIEPGTFYVARIGDEHVLRTETDTKFICVFEPALQGQEEAD